MVSGIKWNSSNIQITFIFHRVSNDWDDLFKLHKEKLSYDSFIILLKVRSRPVQMNVLFLHLFPLLTAFMG